MTQKNLFYFSLMIALLCMVYLYMYDFDEYSETELVRVSYWWVSIFIFSLYGLFHQWKLRYKKGRVRVKNSIVYALVWTSIWLVGMIVFYETIFPEL